MEMLAAFVRYELWCFFGAFFLLVGYRMVTGRINTKGLLSAKGPKAGFSPARAQLIVATLAGAFFYLLEVSNDPSRLPDLPGQLVAVLGGSNLLYVGGKAAPFIFRRAGSGPRGQDRTKGGA